MRRPLGQRPSLSAPSVVARTADSAVLRADVVADLAVLRVVADFLAAGGFVRGAPFFAVPVVSPALFWAGVEVALVRRTVVAALAERSWLAFWRRILVTTERPRTTRSV